MIILVEKDISILQTLCLVDYSYSLYSVCKNCYVRSILTAGNTLLLTLMVINIARYYTYIKHSDLAIVN